MNLIQKLFLSGIILGITTSCGSLDQWDDNDGHNQEEQALETQEPEAPIELEDEISDENIGRLPAKEDGPHILKRDGKYWIIAEPSAQLANVLSSLNQHTEGLTYEPSPGYLRLARELNYRLNEMCFNTQATTEDYKELYSKTLLTLEKIAIAEVESAALAKCGDMCSDKADECEAACDEDKISEESAEEKEDIKLEVVTEHK